MSIEQVVRARHEFEDRLTNFLVLASIMTDREIEIALSRLADMAKHMGESPEVMLRGHVLARYFELRRKNRRPQRAFKRVIFFGVSGMPKYDSRIDRSPSDHYVRSIANFTLLVDGQIAPPNAADGQEIDETILLLAP